MEADKLYRELLVNPCFLNADIAMAVVSLGNLLYLVLKFLG